ncbi:MAG: hypothetical protein V2I24_07295 [Halieaceae bacterium]|jgi:hypothetical protein|nr:hypothetical protein [Halieaceae bacterium]
MSFNLHLGATVLCTHGGTATPVSASARVKLGGQPATTLAHTYTIAGCPLTTPDGPKPCTTVQWTSPATRVRIEGQPALLSTSQGITIGPLGTQGAPMAVAQQVRVRGQ